MTHTPRGHAALDSRVRGNDRVFLSSLLRRIFFWILICSFGMLAPAAHAACGTPTGSAGDIMFNFAKDNMQYCDATNWIAMGPPYSLFYQPYSVYIYRNQLTSDPNAISTNTGGTYWLPSVTNGKTFTASVWFQRDGALNGSLNYFYDISNNAGTQHRLDFEIDTSNKIHLLGYTSGNTKILDINGNTAITDTNWHHVMVSFDLGGTCTNASTAGPSCFIFLDGAAQTITKTTFTNGVIDYSGGNTNVPMISASWVGGTAEVSGGNADNWFFLDQFVDLSQTANQRKFIDANKHPVYLGAHGEAPLGIRPTLYFSLNSIDGDSNRNDYPTNKGGDTNSTWAYGAASTPAGVAGTSNPTLAGTTPHKCMSLSLAGSVTPNSSVFIAPWSDGTYIYAPENGSHSVAAYTFNGSTFTLANRLTLASGTNPYDVWGDGTHLFIGTSNGLYAYFFTGTSWVAAGSYGTGGAIYHVRGDGTYFYAVEAGAGVEALSYNGSSFTSLGFTTGVDSELLFTANGYIFVGDRTNSKLFALTFNGTAFTTVGSITTGAAPYGLYYDGNYFYVGEANQLEAYTFNGSAFTLAGTHTISGANVEYITNGPGHYIYASEDSDGLEALEFDGTNFTTVATYPAYSALYGTFWDGTYLYFGDLGPKLAALTPNTLCCTSPSGYTGDWIYNSASHVPQYCSDLSGWVSMGPAGAGGGGCSSPSGSEGDMIYNSSSNKMQYCDGTTWYSIGK
jgi:hypothetical protein